MSRSVRQLKDQARREEQRENWTRAIELYSEAVRVSEETGDVSLDLSLYNRIGDLYRRQGDLDRAVQNYMEAVDQYAEQGLHTGAVALCDKIQRLAPDRVEVYRKLGRLHAATGLLAEARNSFREYVERKGRAGDEAACRSARLELARLVGDREMLLEVAARMGEAGGEEREAALEALRELRDEADAGEEDGELGELRRLLRDLDPDAEPAGPEGAGQEAADPGAAGPEAPDPAGPEPGGTDPREAGDGAQTECDEQGYVDLGERIRRRLEAEGAGSDRDAAPAPPEHDFDDMLVGFRVRGGETEGEAEPVAHVELGVALRQMGLLDDAIREFQVATRAPEPPLRAFELLGESFIEKGLHSVAVRVLTRALRLPGHSDHELLGVLYQLGLAHQSEANHRQALDCYERVFSIDIDFRDVAERMQDVRLEL